MGSSDPPCPKLFFFGLSVSKVGHQTLFVVQKSLVTLQVTLQVCLQVKRLQLVGTNLW